MAMAEPSALKAEMARDCSELYEAATELASGDFFAGGAYYMDATRVEGAMLSWHGNLALVLPGSTRVQGNGVLWQAVPITDRVGDPYVISRAELEQSQPLVMPGLVNTAERSHKQLLGPRRVSRSA